MQALTGIRVVDLTRVVAGPYCTYQLALMGADCVKLEHVGRGDPVRHSGAGSDSYYWDRGMATNFLPQNANKRSITVNLKDPRGQKIAREFAQRADVLVENFRGGVMDGLGLGYGMAAAFAITTALFQRERDGSGQSIDVSMLDTSLTLMSSYVTDYFATGNPPGPRGNEPASRSPSAGTYDTREGKITLGANEEHQYQRLCRALGLSGFLTDPRFVEIRERRKNRATLYEAFQRVLTTRTADEWETILCDAGVPAARIRSVAEILRHPQVTGRGVLHTFPNVPGLDRDVTVPLSPFRYAHDGPHATTPPPRIGEHTDEVLKELGYTAGEVAALHRDGVT